MFDWVVICSFSFSLGKAVMTDKSSLWLVSLGVEGMTCNSCVQSIEQRIGSLAGVIDVKVQYTLRHLFTIYNHCNAEPQKLNMCMFLGLNVETIRKALAFS